MVTMILMVKISKKLQVCQLTTCRLCTVYYHYNYWSSIMDDIGDACSHEFIQDRLLFQWEKPESGSPYVSRLASAQGSVASTAHFTGLQKNIVFLSQRLYWLIYIVFLELNSKILTVFLYHVRVSCCLLYTSFCTLMSAFQY